MRRGVVASTRMRFLFGVPLLLLCGKNRRLNREKPVRLSRISRTLSLYLVARY